jgi:hypothetical protein
MRPMHQLAPVLLVLFALAPLGARAADLVVWWDEGYYAEEDEAVREIIAAFEHKTGKQVARCRARFTIVIGLNLASIAEEPMMIEGPSPNRAYG